ncbi:LrgB family protein [Leeia sp. TBRC 13508]|uniref:LrgB family protein n=1 Tax=Leeia speluncae TaxID=2884804 RepID=A0ABS8DAW8_9NEIS|nr:LrgB family protein [Leeia speluncae]MCB6185356.1 LrgB family protein [Leeia speluncae]
MTSGIYQWIPNLSPYLISTTITLIVYVFAMQFHLKMNRVMWSYPIIISVAVLVTILSVTQTKYEDYFEGTKYLSFLLGPATVALAMPLYAQITHLKKYWLPVIGSIFAGSVVAILSVVYLGQWLGLSRETLMSMVPKSSTTPIAMALAEQLGGSGSLAAAMVLLTGTFGALAARPFFKSLGLDEDQGTGLAMGTASHGFATAKALQENLERGAYAGLAMGVNGALTAWLTGPILHWIGLI